jgi:hypothetical protein
MTREEKTVLLAVLVPLFFGGFILFEKGSFILPFPLNESIFLIVSILFTIRVGKHFLTKSIFSTAFAFFNLLSTEFFWSFFIPQQTLYAFSQSGTLDLLKLLSAVLLVIWAGITLIKGKDQFSNFLFLVFFVLYSGALIFQIPALEVFATLIPFASIFKYRDHFPYHLLWLLLSILGTMKLVMLSF